MIFSLMFAIHQFWLGPFKPSTMQLMKWTVTISQLLNPGDSTKDTMELCKDLTSYRLLRSTEKSRFKYGEGVLISLHHLYNLKIKEILLMIPDMQMLIPNNYPFPRFLWNYLEFKRHNRKGNALLGRDYRTCCQIR